ncbi:MAG: response regulator transcription factor [Gemmatimonadaceae bacterium]|nr:response regulator transcription factor [Gemmatimonadaceae bacterium]
MTIQVQENSTATRALTVLVVDDDAGARELIRLALEPLGVSVTEAGTASEALTSAAVHEPNVVVLDLGLPDRHGLDVLRDLRRESQAAVIVFSGSSAEEDKIALLDAGADDYLVKPIGIAELQARFRAHARRLESEARAADEFAVSIGGVTVDLLRRRVTRDGRDVRLTPTEWSLLRVLARHAGEFLSADRLWTEVWDREFGDARLNVRVHVSHLRRKIEPDPSHPVLLVSEPKLGYTFRVPSPQMGAPRSATTEE